VLVAGFYRNLNNALGRIALASQVAAHQRTGSGPR
jgi:hypothetical protein